MHAKLSFVSDSILDRSGLECYHKLNRYAHIAGGIKLSAKHTDAELECCEEHIVHTDAVMAARSAMPAEEITTDASDFFTHSVFQSVFRQDPLADTGGARFRGAVCLRYCIAAEHEPVRDIASASFFEAGAAGQESKKRKNSILCAVR